MMINCLYCNENLHLNHAVFQEYRGPVKCFSCGSFMDVDIADGKLRGPVPGRSALPVGQQSVYLPAQPPDVSLPVNLRWQTG
ncbi:MAG: hypothetical protein P8165_09480 [Deltaproteobacteria bacterium]|jgi:hypothetical protein